MTSYKIPNKNIKISEIGYKNIRLPNILINPKNHDRLETLIILDWDDTLLCSSFFKMKNITLHSTDEELKEYEKELIELADNIINIIKIAQEHGSVIIITNADAGWVEMSSQKFIPSIIPLLENLTIISAKTTYESNYPNSIHKWKQLCIIDYISPFIIENSKKRHIISIGDSHSERYAILQLKSDKTLIKSIKLKDLPSIHILNIQLKHIYKHFISIFNNEQHLDVELKLDI